MEELIKQEYIKLDSPTVSYAGKVNLLNNIIQFKILEVDFRNYQNDLSVDVKRYLNSVIDLAENGARNYDLINKDKIIELLYNFDKTDQLVYLDYFIRTLEKSSFKNEIRKYQELRYDVIIKNSLENFWSIQSIWNLLVYFPLLNITTLIITLLGITIIANLVLLPAPFDWMSFMNFRIEYLKLSDNFLPNHFINITSAFIGVNDDLKIIPLNLKSMILLICGRIFMFAYVVSLIFNKLTDLIKR